MVEFVQTPLAETLGWYAGLLFLGVAMWAICSDAASERVAQFARTHDQTMRSSAMVAVAPAIMLAMEVTISYCTEANLRAVCGDDLWEYCWFLFGCWQLPNASTVALWLFL